jgi:hypothetical protein
MAVNIKLKRSALPGKIPSTSSLELGEVALNTYDGRAFMKQQVGSTETVIEFATTAGSGSTVTSASYANYATNAGFATNAGNANTANYATSASYADNASSANSASYALNSTSASYAVTASYTPGATSASYALSASYAQTSSYAIGFNISGNLIVGGDITAQTLHVQTVTSSIIYSSGSNVFGDSTADTQTLNGTVNISGSLNVTGSATINDLTGSLYGTASWALNAQNATTASYANNATSASYALNSTSGAYAVNATTASYALDATSASYALNSTSGAYAVNATTASYANVATSASYASNAELLDGLNSTAFATTASYNAFTQSYYSDSSSFDGRILANSSSITSLSSSYLNSSSSFDTRILANSSSISLLSGSFLTTSSSFDTRILANSSSIGLLSSSFLNFSSSFSTGSFTGSFRGAFTGSFSGSLFNLNGVKNYIPVFDSTNTISSSIIYQSASYIAINENNFTADHPEALYVFQTNPTSYNAITARGNSNNYLQLNIQNTNLGISASSDVVATANNGTEEDMYIDMGINNENYTYPGGVGAANDTYVYGAGRNFHIGNTKTGHHLGFFVGGFDSDVYRKFQLNATSSHEMSGSLDISGSLIVRSGITGSLFGTASWALNSITSSYAVNSTSASYALTAAYASNVPLTASYAISASNAITASYAVVATSASYAATATSGAYSVNATSASYALTASYASNVPLTASYAISASNALTASYVNPLRQDVQISGSLGISGSGTVLSANVDTIVFTGSFLQSGSVNVNGNITTTGTITAQTLNVQVITSSVDFVTGSTRFGTELSNTHQFTGSVSITGSLAVNNSAVILSSQTSSMSVLSAQTASYVQNAQSASYVLNAVSASYAASASNSLFAQTASYWSGSITNAESASYAASASNALAAQTASYVQNAQSASYWSGSITNAESASYALTASYAANVPETASYATSASYAASASNALAAQTASYVLNAVSASYSNNSNTASYAITASYAMNGGGGGLSALYIQDEGITQGTASYIDFTGAGVTATVSNGTASINIPGGGGGSGIEGQNAILNQTVAATTWSFTHNLGTQYPVFTIFDSNDNVIIPQQIYAASTSSALIYFSTARAGHAVASLGGGIVSSSYAVSASYALNSTSASYALNASSASYALTSSYSQNASSSQNASDIVVYVQNNTGAQINKGSVVKISGAVGDNPQISLADWTNDSQSANTIGLVMSDIADGSNGYVMTEGRFIGYDTSTPGWSAGQLLFLGASGSITGSAPQAPLHGVRLGQVLRVQQNNGSIYIRIDNGYELGELHDVRDSSTTASYGDLFIKNGNVWINSKQLTGSYGLTGSLTANSINATSLTASNATIGGNLVVNGTASFNYVQTITGSAVIVGQEYIILNSQSPAARFAGIQVYDSGSTSSTASLAWDSDRNHWVYQNASGSSYSGGGLMSGPRNTGSIGDETYPTLNRVLRGQGGDHLYDSNIFDDNSTIRLEINTAVTGTLNVTNGITGSLLGTATNANTASYVANAQSASYILNAISASYASSASNSLFAQTASYVLNAQTASYVQTAETASYILNAVSASYAASASNTLFAQTASYWSGSIINAETASYVQNAQSASYILNAVSASHADSASNAIAAQTASSADNFTVRGTLTAQTLVVQTVTSSVVYSSGSNIFGNDLTNTQVLTGSVTITGSLAVNGSNVIVSSQTSSMSVATASYWSGSITNAATASYVQNAQSASYVLNAVSSSFATTASYSPNYVDLTTNQTISGQKAFVSGISAAGGISFPDNVTGSNYGGILANSSYFQIAAQGGSSILIKASDGTNGIVMDTVGNLTMTNVNATSFTGSLLGTVSTASYVQTAQTASYVQNAQSASYILNAVSSSYSNNSNSSSYALTASYALFAANGGGGGISAISIADDGALKGTASYFDFTGAGVTANVSNGTASIDITGGGGGGTSGLSTFFTQSVAAVTWSFTHNLNTRTPLVQVYDSSYQQITPQYVSASNGSVVEIGFGIATAGYAVASTGGTLYVTGSNVILDQTVAATTWSFNHGLNTQYPVFQVFNTSDEVIVPEVIKAVDSASALIYFPTPVAGKAVASLGGISGSMGSGVGFPYSGSAVITGSFLVSQSFVDFTQASYVTGSFTGSLLGTASLATTASYATFALSASNAPGFTVQFSQTSSAATWSFTHNLNTRNPIVQVYGIDYKQIIPNDIVGVDANTAEVRFDYATTGYAVMSNGGGLYITGSTSELAQTTASVTWSFNHNLNSKYVNFTVYDSNDYVIIPANIRAIDSNSAELHFATSQTGRAVAQFSGINGAPNATTASYALTSSYATTFTLDRSLLDYSLVNSSTVGSNNVFTQATGSYTSMFINYTAASGSNARAGQVTAVWNGGTVEFNDVSTADIGTTTAVTSSVIVVSGDAQFNIQTNTSGWRIKSTVTFI